MDGIRQVVNIAASNSPILSTYSSICQTPQYHVHRRLRFQWPEDLWPYLTGDWSEEYSVEPMLFDLFLFVSQVMVVAKEAHTSLVKDLIVAAPGVADAQWQGTYDEGTACISTVRSELGDPIHKIATRGVALWKEFDNTVFHTPKDKRAGWLAERGAEIIKKFNEIF